MAESFVQVAPDSTGKKVQTFDNTVNGVANVQANAVALVNELGVPFTYTGFRDLVVAQRFTALADSLADGISSFWTQTLANDGTITSTVGEGQLKTSVAVNGSAHMRSPVITYHPGQINWVHATGRFGDLGVAGNIRRVGMFTVSGDAPQEGFYYELDGTVLYACHVKAGVVTRVASTAWTRAADAPFTLTTGYHSLEIRYAANTVWFFTDHVLRHVATGVATPLTTTLALPMAIQNVKTSGATDVTFAIRNIGNGRFGMPGSAVLETGLMAVEALSVGGATPHDSVDSGNPLKVGGVARATVPAAVADGDRVNGWFTPNGAQVVRDNRDQGRVLRNLFMAVPILSTTAEVMMLLTGVRGTTAEAQTATPTVVSAGKTYRINSIVLEHKAIASLTGVMFRLRANPAGVAVVGSTLIDNWTIGPIGPAAPTAGAQAPAMVITFPEGLEFAAGTGLGLGMIGIAATGAPGTAGGYGRASIYGYEY